MALLWILINLTTLATNSSTTAGTTATPSSTVTATAATEFDLPASASIDYDTCLSNVSGLYDPGNVIAWYLLLMTVMLATKPPPTDRIQSKVIINLITALALPIIAGLHLVWLTCVHSSWANSPRCEPTDKQCCQAWAAMEAPVSVITGFITISPVLFSLLYEGTTKITVAIYSAWASCTTCYLCNLWLLVASGRPNVLQPMLTAVFSLTSLCFSGIIWLLKSKREASHEEGEHMASHAPPWLRNVCNTYRAWLSPLALIIIKAIRVYFWEEEKSQWIWPRTQASLGDLDQVVALVIGVVQSFCTLYLAYLRYQQKKEEGAEKRMEDPAEQTRDKRVLVGGIGGTGWEREAAVARIRDAVSRFWSTPFGTRL